VAYCPAPPNTVTPGYFSSTFTSHALAGIQPTALTGVDPSSNSALAFVTYTGASGVLPFYLTSNSSTGSLTLANGATASTAPVAGIFSTDNLTFFTGTGTPDGSSAGNDVHLITLTYPSTGAPTLTDSGVLSPNLQNANGNGFAPVNLLAQHPKRLQS
jgi:hypothetical protein